MTTPSTTPQGEPTRADDAPATTVGDDPWATRADAAGAVPPTLADIPKSSFGAGEFAGIGPAGNIRRIGDYEIIRYIAKGGMGAVYEAVHLELGLPVALKMINSGNHASELDVQRFLVEARAVAALHRHPNIVKIHHIGQEDKQHYLVMQFVRGGSLTTKLGEFRDDPRRAVAIMVKVAEAIAYAHRKGLLHRDLKPDNVLLDDDGTPCVTDFGLAKRVDPSILKGADRDRDSDGDAPTPMPDWAKPRAVPGDDPDQLKPEAFQSSETAGGTILGTPSYMPPEQALGQVKDVTTLSDVYGLGATLFCLLCGRAPFLGRYPLDILNQVVNDPPPRPRSLNPKVDADLEAICLKCLEKDPGQRYESALALVRDLGRWLDRRPVHARPLPPRERAIRWVRREPRKVALIALGVVMFSLAVGLAITQHRGELLRQKELVAEQKEKVAEQKEKVAGQEAEFSRKSATLIQARSGEILAQARTAINLFVGTCDAELVDDLQQSLRRKLLTHALDYFVKVVDSEKDYLGGDLAHLVELAKAHRKVAEIAHKIGVEGREMVDDHFEALIKILEKVKGRRDEDGNYPKMVFTALKELGDGYHEYGVLYSDRGQADTALAYFEKGRKVREGLCEPCPNHDNARACGCIGDPDVRTGLGRSHGYIGDVHRAAGRDDQAEAAYMRSHKIRERLHADFKADPGRRADLTIQLGRSYGNLASLSRHRGDLADAVRQRMLGLDLLRGLLDTRGLDVATRQKVLADLVGGFGEVAEFYLEDGQPKKALDAIAATLIPFVELNRGENGVAPSNALRAAAEVARAEALYRSDLPDEAQAACAAAQNHLDEARDVREDVIYKRTTGLMEDIRGKIAFDRGRADESKAALERARSAFDELVRLAPQNLEHKSDRAEILADLARALAKLGDPGFRETLRQAIDDQKKVADDETQNKHFQARLARYRDQLAKLDLPAPKSD